MCHFCDAHYDKFESAKKVFIVRDELLKGLTKEQITKIKRCKDQSELLALAKAEGVELSEEQLEAVNGGMCSTKKCPKCGASDFRKETRYVGVGGAAEIVIYTCNKCGEKWS